MQLFVLMHEDVVGSVFIRHPSEEDVRAVLEIVGLVKGGWKLVGDLRIESGYVQNTSLQTWLVNQDVLHRAYRSPDYPALYEKASPEVKGMLPAPKRIEQKKLVKTAKVFVLFEHSNPEIVVDMALTERQAQELLEWYAARGSDDIAYRLEHCSRVE